MQRGRGRPAKLTPETHKIIVSAIEKGNYVETAAGLAGVDKQSLYSWLKKGNQASKGIYRDFLDAVNVALASSEAKDVERLNQAADKHWQATAWRLERRFPRKWGHWQREEVEAEPTTEVSLSIITQRESGTDES